MSVGESVRSASASYTSPSNRVRFAPGLDFSYRFRSASPFKEQKISARPSTTPASLPSHTYRTGRHHKSFVDAIASAQTPSIETIKHSLGDGLLMLRQGRNYITPSIFVNLDKIHLRDIKTVSDERRKTAPAFSIPRQPPIPKREEQVRPQSTASRLSSHRVPVADTSSSPTDARQNGAVGQMVVEFLTKVENREKSARKLYRPRLDYSLNTEVDDRCARNSDFPEIQIDGRPLSQTLRTRDGYMPREHCDVLGPHTCPDCIRTRSQNSHLRMCSVAVAANATDVYKLALIHERIPHIAMRELQRKIYDGEISDKVNSISRWKEMKHSMKLNSEDKTGENSSNMKEIDVVGQETATDQQENARPKLKSRGSLSSGVFETIAESSEPLELQKKRETDEIKTSNIAETETLASEDADNNTAIKSSSDKPNTDNSLDIKKDELPTKEAARSTQNTNPPNTRPESAKKHRTRSKKKQPKRQLRVFNRGLIPSPNYFYSVTDLMERVQRIRRVKKKSSWEVEIVEAQNDNALEVEALVADQAKEEETKDETSSLCSLDSFSPRKDELKQFEPPIMYEKKSRYLGVKPQTVGNLQIEVSA